MSLLYNFFLLLIGLLALPSLCWKCLRHGKYRQSLKERLGFNLPPLGNGNKQTIWIHVVSVGETRAVSALYKELQKKTPHARFIISSITETGHAEAKRSLPGAAGYLFLPLDFSWAIKKAVKAIHPDLLILVEGEFWYNMCRYTKHAGAKIALVNGKLSERSFKRFKTVPFFSRRLFNFLDLFCVQSDKYAERFLALGVPQQKIAVTGNIKLDVAAPRLSLEQKKEWRENLGIQEGERVVVVGSTHPSEEEQILSALKPVWEKIPTVKALIVPRHPERFSAVADLIKSLGFSLMTYSQKAEKTGDERVILIDAMGLLSSCYQLADVAIVAGSFTDKVGGHNIFEPVQVGVPVLFGPHMHTQADLVDLVLGADAGKQVSLEQLAPTLLDLLQNGAAWDRLHQNCLSLATSACGATTRTLLSLQTFVEV